MATLTFYVYAFLSGLEFIDLESFEIWFPMVFILFLILILFVWLFLALTWIPVRYLWLKRKTSLWRSFTLTLKIGLLLGLVTLTWHTWLTTRPEHVQR